MKIIKINIKLFNISCLLVLLFSCFPVFALTFNINHNKDLVGKIQYIMTKPGDSFYEIAREFDVGTLELIKANSKVSMKKALPAGIEILIPSQFILPPGQREGIVLNLPELRLYYYHPDSNLVTTYPVGIGRAGWRTPLGITKVVTKRDHPTWTPPPSIREYYEEKGEILPDHIGPGPKNPLGAYAMNLGWQNYIIHGTNKPDSVGLRSSSGCIRMYPEDIEELFNLVELGTVVRVIHDPIKLGVDKDKIYIEVHQALKEAYYRQENNRLLEVEIKDIINENNNKINIHDLDWTKITNAVKQSYGYPQEI